MTSTASDTSIVCTAFDINAEFRSVMHELGLSPEDTGGEITFVGEDPIFPSVPGDGVTVGAEATGQLIRRYIQLNHLVQLGRANSAGHSVRPFCLGVTSQC